MENNAAAKSASYSKLNDWNQANTRTPLTSRGSKLSRWKCIFVALVIVSCFLFIAFGIGFGLNKIHQKTSRPTIQQPFVRTFNKAAVASQSAICSEIGRDIMQKSGGSAVDAAIATLLCEGAYSPQSAGLGGGFFMITYSRDKGEVDIIDARETAPLASHRDMFVNNKSAALKGGLAIAVPGELRGYQMAHERYGRVKWADLFKPTIELCKNGITISKYLESILLGRSYNDVLAEPTLSALYVNNQTKDVKREGEVAHLHQLAETLEIIADKGADELYTGNLSKLLLSDLKDFGSIINATDLENYRAKLRKPAMYQLNNGVRFYSMPPPGSGHLLGLLIKVLDSYMYNSSSVVDESDNITFYHRFIEACKYAYAKRPEIGDPDFERNVTDLITLLSSPELALNIKNSIMDNVTFDPLHYGTLFQSKLDHGTAQVTVWAPNGDVVSATSTLNTWFGAKIRSPSTGIVLNNEMDDFSTPDALNFYGLPPAAVNFIKPGKRPASSMTPSIALTQTGEPLYVLGASGGSKIISSLSYVYALHNFFNKSLEEAIEVPRLHHQLYPDEVLYEDGIPLTVIEGLEEKGHKLTPIDWKPAVYFLSQSEDGSIVAGADPRRFGVPAGY